MSEQLLKKLARPLILLATLIWGSTFFIMKDTLNEVDLQFLLAFRFTFASLVLGLVFAPRWRRLDSSYWWRGGLMGILLYVAYTVQNLGLMGTTPGKNAFFTAVYCVLVPFLSWAVERRSPDRFQLLGAVLCVAGIGLVSWDGGLSLGAGDALTLLSGLFYAAQIITTARFAPGRDIFLLSAIQFGTTALCCWAGTFVTGGLPVHGLSTQAWLVLLYLAFAATTLALLFQNIGQMYTDPSAAAVLLSLEAPFGVLFSVLFTDEAPTPLMYAGFVLIFAAVLCAETKLDFLRPRSRAPHPSL